MTVLDPQGTPVETSRRTHKNDVKIDTAYDAQRKVGRVKMTVSLADDQMAKVLANIRELIKEALEPSGFRAPGEVDEDSLQRALTLIAETLAEPAMLALDMAPEQATMVGMRFITTAESCMNFATSIRMMEEMGGMPVSEAVKAIGIYHIASRSHHHAVFQRDQDIARKMETAPAAPEGLDESDPKPPVM